MHPRVGRHGTQSEVKGPGTGDQARPAPLAICALLLLAGCSEVPRDIDPRYWWRNLSGAYLDGREPPPGRDAPYPNLATVPARPVPPSAAERAALSAALAADREGSRTEMTAPTPAVGGEQPPTPPRFSAAPVIRPEPMPAPAAPAALVPAAPTAPGAAQPAPPPLSGPPAAPGADLLAPPPPPGADLLAPRRD